MNSFSAREPSHARALVNGTDVREARPKIWVAAYTRPRSEKKTFNDLEKSGIESYLPLQKQVHLWSDRKKTVEVAIIPMIVFIHGSEEEIKQVSYNPLILKILSRPGERTPASIPDRQIERLRYVLSQSETSVIFDPGFFSVNDNVRIVTGRLRGVEGMIEECEDGTVDLIVAIDLLGGARLKISKNDIERIE